MSVSRKQPMPEQEIEFHIKDIAATQAIEGIAMTPENEQDMRDILSGKISIEEASTRAIARARG